MAVITMKQLLEAGVHFGHHTRRWNPKMKEYIFGERNGVYIIDLQKTADKIEEAYAAMVNIVRNNNKVLFVGTRKQIQDVIKEEATRCEQYYVDKRWLGGTMTNFKTLRKSIAKLHKYEEMQENGTFDLLPKKEVAALKADDFQGFLATVKDSGDSSYKFLQNVYTSHDVQHQNVSIALAVSESILKGKGAWRVHGGGFAGTIQVFLPKAEIKNYVTDMEKVFGENSCYILSVRSHGGCEI